MEKTEIIIMLILGLTALLTGLSFIDTQHMNEIQSEIRQNKVLLKSALGAILDLEKAVDELTKEINHLKNNKK